MKNILYAFVIMLVAWSCTTTKTVATTDKKTTDSEVVRIANDSLEYQIIVTDIGFSNWLTTRAYPRNYYSQAYLENKNRNYVQEYNVRTNNPQRFGELYEFRIDYQPQINYGYEVNYLLYNYFIFFQNTYNQKLGGYVPPR